MSLILPFPLENSTYTTDPDQVYMQGDRALPKDQLDGLIRLVQAATKSKVVDDMVADANLSYERKVKLLEEVLFHEGDAMEAAFNNNVADIARKIDDLKQSDNEGCTIHHVVKHYGKKGKVTYAAVRDRLKKQKERLDNMLKDSNLKMKRGTGAVTKEKDVLNAMDIGWKTMLFFMQQSIMHLSGEYKLNMLLQPPVNNRGAEADFINKELMASLSKEEGVKGWDTQIAGVIPYTVSKTVKTDADGNQMGTKLESMIVTGRKQAEDDLDVELYANPIELNQLEKIYKFLTEDDVDYGTEVNDQEKVKIALDSMMLAFKVMFDDFKDIASVQDFYLLARMEYEAKTEFDVNEESCMSFPRGCRELFEQSIVYFQAKFDVRFGMYEGQKRLGCILLAMIGRSIFFLDTTKYIAFMRRYGSQENLDYRRKLIERTNGIIPVNFWLPFKTGPNGSDKFYSLSPKECYNIREESANLADNSAQSQERTPRNMMISMLDHPDMDEILLPIPLTNMMSSYLFYKRGAIMHLMFPHMKIKSFDSDFKYAKSNNLKAVGKESSENRNADQNLKDIEASNSAGVDDKAEGKKRKTRAGRGAGRRKKTKTNTGGDFIDDEAEEDEEDDEDGNDASTGKVSGNLRDVSLLDPTANVEDLIEFVVGIRTPTFKDYPLEIEEQMNTRLSDIAKKNDRTPGVGLPQNRKELKTKYPDYKPVNIECRHNIIKSMALKAGSKSNSPIPKVLCCVLSAFSDFLSGSRKAKDTFKQVLLNDGLRSSTGRDLTFQGSIYSNPDKTVIFQTQKKYSKKGFIPNKVYGVDKSLDGAYWFWCVPRPLNNLAEAILQNYFQTGFVTRDARKNVNKLIFKEPTMFPSKYGIGQAYAEYLFELCVELGIFVCPSDSIESIYGDYYTFVTEGFLEYQETGSRNFMLIDDTGDKYVSNLPMFFAFLVVLVRDEKIHAKFAKDDPKQKNWDKKYPSVCVNTQVGIYERPEDYRDSAYDKYYYQNSLGQFKFWIVSGFDEDNSVHLYFNEEGLTLKEMIYLLIFKRHPFRSDPLAGMDQNTCDNALRILINHVMTMYVDMEKKNYQRFFDRYDGKAEKKITINTKRVAVLPEATLEKWKIIVQNFPRIYVARCTCFSPNLKQYIEPSVRIELWKII